MWLPQHLGLRYALFAVWATLGNITTQAAVVRLSPGPVPVLEGLAAGTLAGLVIKYWLDRRYIFFQTGGGWRAHGVTFPLYGLTGVFTTLIFWSTELAFEAATGSETMRYLGAVCGLSLGYLIKYRLDRRFVFRRADQ